MHVNFAGVKSNCSSPISSVEVRSYMEVFINQFGKINNAVLPLRFGISIAKTHQYFAKLEDPVLDEEGTRRQRDDEKFDKATSTLAHL